MADHGAEAPRGQKPSRRRRNLEVDADIEAGRGGRLHQRELLASTKAHIRLLRRDLDIRPEPLHRGEDCLINGTQARLGPRILVAYRVVAASELAPVRHRMRDQIGVAVTEAVLRLEEGHHLSVL